MELREFFAIFGIHKKVFWSIIFLFLFGGVLFYFLQEQTYKTVLTLNITRDSELRNNEYGYDDFYRLQADERFADTVVRWTQAPHIINTSFENVAQKNKRFDTKRLSSQVVRVLFVTNTKKDAEIVTRDLVDTLNKESKKLNQKQRKDHWFMILGSPPVIEDNTKSLLFLFSITGFFGFFIAFWTVMVKHYIKEG